jgi:hypothetical protein
MLPSGGRSHTVSLSRVTLRDGSTWLVHKGDGFGISSQTVVVDARHMSTSWQVRSPKSVYLFRGVSMGAGEDLPPNTWWAREGYSSWWTKPATLTALVWTPLLLTFDGLCVSLYFLRKNTNVLKYFKLCFMCLDFGNKRFQGDQDGGWFCQGWRLRLQPALR